VSQKLLSHLIFPLSQLGDLILDTRGDLTILALQLAQSQELACGVGRIAGYVTANGFDVLLNIPKLLREEDSERFISIYAHILETSLLFSIKRSGLSISEGPVCPERGRMEDLPLPFHFHSTHQTRVNMTHPQPHVILTLS
jgi:hypothetical protein